MDSTEGLQDTGGAETANMADTAGDAWDEAFSEAEEDGAPSSVEPLRDERGKFKGTDTAPAADATPATPDATAVDTTPAEQAPAPAGPDLSKAPSSWRADAQAAWTTAPEAIRAEVLRRESDFHAGIGQYREAAQFGGAFAKALAPYAEQIRAAGVEPAQAAAELFGLEAALRNPQTAKDTILALARSYGVNFNAAEAQPAPADQHYRALEQQLSELKGYIQTQQQQSRAEMEQTARDDIEAFGADAKNAHFAEVKGEMGRLLSSGAAKSLADAYERAVWIVPATRAKMIAAQQRAQAAEAAKKAAEAKAAATVNLQKRGTTPASTPIGKMSDTAGQIWDKHFG